MPPLDWKLVSFPFGHGLAQGTAPALVPPTHLHTAEQALISKEGSVEQRPGTESLGVAKYVWGSTGTISKARHLFTAERETLMTSPERLYTYQEADAKWRDLDHAYEADISRVIQGERNSEANKVMHCADVAHVGDHAVYAWVDTTNDDLFVRFIDYSTEARNEVYYWSYVSTVTNVRIVVAGTLVHVVWHDSATSQIKATTWDTADISVAPTTTVLGSNATGFFDACSTVTNVYVAYSYSSGPTVGSCVVRCGLDLTSSTNTIVTGASPSNKMAVGVDPDDTIYVAYPTAANYVDSFARVDDAGLTQRYAPQNVRAASQATNSVIRTAIVADAANRRAFIAWEAQAYTLGPVVRSTNGAWIDPAGTVTEGHKGWFTGLVSKPVLYDSKIYCVAHLYEEHSSTYGDETLTTTQRNAYFVELQVGTMTGGEIVTWEDAEARVVTRIATHTIGDMGAQCPACNLAETATGKYLALLPMLSETATGLREGFDLYEVQFDHPELHTPAWAQGEPVLSGGVPAVYDGRKLSELGSHYYPLFGGVESEATGSLDAGGTYQWQAVFEWRDAHGVRHQSAPSMIVEKELDPGDTGATIVVSNLCLTERQDVASAGHKVRIVFYRTKNGGAIFYRENDVATVNDPSTATTSHSSTVQDSDIVTHDILYTDGGVAANFQPPAARHIIQHDRRLWLISRDDPSLIWISKILPQGAEVPGFPLELVMRDEEGGGNVALASLGETLIALKEQGIYAYSGSPPNDLLAGGNLSGPHPIALHTGCVNPKSVVVCPTGVAFQSRETIWLINRGMQCERVGKPVEDYIGSYPQCTGAVLDQRRNCVYFSMSKTDFSQGVTLVWHYLVGKSGEWAVWHLPKSDETVAEAARSAAMCWRGGLDRFEYHQSQANGHVVYLDNGYIDHDGTYPALKISTSWFQAAGIAGFQRVKRLSLMGIYRGIHSMSIGLYYDFEDTPRYTITKTEAEVLAMLNNPDEHLRIHLPDQKCKSVRAEVTATTGTGITTGATVRWESWGAEVGGKQGIFKLPAAGSW